MVKPPEPIIKKKGKIKLMARPNKKITPEEEKAAQLARDLNEHMSREHLIPASLSY